MPTRDKDGVLRFKIVYWGPHKAGKTTALKFVAESGDFGTGELQSVKDPLGVTLFFDRWVAKVGTNEFQVYATAGTRKYNVERKTVLKDAEGIIFIWDCDPEQQEENAWSLDELVRVYGGKITPQGQERSEVPFLVMANKRDLPNAISLDSIRGELAKHSLGNVPIEESTATGGQNVKPPFAKVAKAVLLRHYAKVKPT